MPLVRFLVGSERSENILLVFGNRPLEAAVKWLNGDGE
jgi:hypothetical protein